jgi:predicted DNA-binding transcriptional regulator YafY
MKFEIIVRILFDLLSKKVVNAKYLSDKYEVSTRSIYRYISVLEDAGVPIYTIRGNQGGFSIVDSYRLSCYFLTKPELEQTIGALNGIINGVPNKTLSQVIDKLKSNLKNTTDDLLLKTGNLIIDAGPWGNAIGYKNKLAVVQKALDSNLVLNITYHDRDGEITDRNIYPHVIVFKQGLWYVYAYCCLRKKFRFFKLGRIEKAIITDQIFERKNITKDDMPLNFWENATNTENVILEINKKYLSDVEEWLGIENVKSVNGKFIADVTLPYDGGLVSKIMSFGDGVTVISPEKLVNEIKTHSQKILAKYN